MAGELPGVFDLHTFPTDQKARCPLTDHPAAVYWIDNRPLVRGVECPACGFFEISAPALARVQRELGDNRYELAYLARTASDKYHSEPSRFRFITILEENLPALFQSVVVPRDPYELVDRLLVLAASRGRSFFDLVKIDATVDYPLLCARDGAEAQGAIKVAHQEGFIEGIRVGWAITLTASGWQRVNSLNKPRSSSDVAFVAMWLDPQVNPVYDEGFKPALEEVGYRPVRIDRENFPNRVDDEIMVRIRESGLLVADFTGNRGGVYFEAGFAFGLGTNVIFTCRKDHFKDVHFDTNHYPFVLWETEQDLKEQLINRVEGRGLSRISPP